MLERKSHKSDSESSSPRFDSASSQSGNDNKFELTKNANDDGLDLDRRYMLDELEQRVQLITLLQTFLYEK